MNKSKGMNKPPKAPKPSEGDNDKLFTIHMANAAGKDRVEHRRDLMRDARITGDE